MELFLNYPLVPAPYSGGSHSRGSLEAIEYLRSREIELFEKATFLFGCGFLLTMEASCLQLSCFVYSGAWEFFAYTWSLFSCG